MLPDQFELVPLLLIVLLPQRSNGIPHCFHGVGAVGSQAVVLHVVLDHVFKVFFLLVGAFAFVKHLSIMCNFLEPLPLILQNQFFFNPIKAFVDDVLFPPLVLNILVKTVFQLFMKPLVYQVHHLIFFAEQA